MDLETLSEPSRQIASDVAAAEHFPFERCRHQHGRIANDQVLNAAQELMRVAGGWQAALALTAELARTLTGAYQVAITLAGRRPVCSSDSVEEGRPLRATVAAPIHEGERTIGHLEVCATEFGAFDEEDLRAVSVLAVLLSAMARLDAAKRQEAPRKPPLAARIVNRVEGMFPRTIRVHLVL